MSDFFDIDYGMSTKLPVIFCIDISGSMTAVDNAAGGFVKTGRTFEEDGKVWNEVTGGTCYIDYVCQGLNAFLDEITNDSEANDVCECSVVAFNDKTYVLEDFKQTHEIKRRNTDEWRSYVKGDTDINQALTTCLDILDKRKAHYKTSQIPYQQPWLVLFSDGVSQSEVTTIKSELLDRINKKKLTVFVIAVTPNAKETLSGFSTIEPISYKDPKKMKSFFTYLAKSLSASATTGNNQDAADEFIADLSTLEDDD